MDAKPYKRHLFYSQPLGFLKWPSMQHLREVALNIHPVTFSKLSDLLESCPQLENLTVWVCNESDFDKTDMQELPKKVAKLPLIRHLRVLLGIQSPQNGLKLLCQPDAFPLVTTLDLDAFDFTPATGPVSPFMLITPHFEMLIHDHQVEADSTVFPILPSLCQIIWSDRHAYLHWSRHEGLTAKVLETHIPHFWHHKALQCIALRTPPPDPPLDPNELLDSPLIIDSQPLDSVVLRSYKMDKTESLFHFRYTSGQAPPRIPTRRKRKKIFTGSKKTSGSETPNPSSSQPPLPMKQHNWKDFIIFEGEASSLELLSDIFAELGINTEWTEPQPRLELPDGCYKKFRYAVNSSS